MVGWAVIIYEIFAGEAGKAAASASESVQSAYQRDALDRIGWLGDLPYRVCRRGLGW